MQDNSFKKEREGIVKEFEKLGIDVFEGIDDSTKKQNKRQYIENGDLELIKSMETELIKIKQELISDKAKESERDKKVQEGEKLIKDANSILEREMKIGLKESEAFNQQSTSNTSTITNSINNTTQKGVSKDAKELISTATSDLTATQSKQNTGSKKSVEINATEEWPVIQKGSPGKGRGQVMMEGLISAIRHIPIIGNWAANKLEAKIRGKYSPDNSAPSSNGPGSSGGTPGMDTLNSGQSSQQPQKQQKGTQNTEQSFSSVSYVTPDHTPPDKNKGQGQGRGT